MTNPTPHGQVPDTLIDLIDTYAETRHRCGGIYNARAEAARKAVIEALSGVKALSAAPRTPTVEQVEDEVSMGHGAWDMVDPQELIGAVLRLSVAASPTPPAEQQAAPKAAPGEREQAAQRLRELAGVSENDVTDPLHPRYIEGYKAGHAAERKRAAPPTEQAAPKAAPGVGNSGFDHKTAADFLNGKTVSDEAVRKFVAVSRWAHDERAALSATLLAMHGVLTSREAEIALLKKALLEAEAAPQPAPDCHHRPPCDECAAIAAQGGRDAG